MSKKSTVFLTSCLVIVFILALTESAYAHHKKRVLGDSTSASQLVFPPVTSGAGFILPDSPLFFLDRMFQQVRLLTAFTSERRAEVHREIAKERLAELRIMLSRNNSEGINTALTHLNKEIELSVNELSDAASQGKDVSLVAKQINETIKTQRKILGILADQSEGVLKLQFKAVKEALKEAKIEVEDELPEDELEKEIEDELEDEIEDEVQETSESALKIEELIVRLEKEASRSAEKALKRREQTIRKAIEEQNKEQEKLEKELRKEEIKKQEEILKAKKQATEEARKASKETQKAAERLRNLQEKVEDIRNTPVSTDSSGSSKNSGSDESSGSSNSGSGSSGSGSSGGSNDD